MVETIASQRLWQMLRIQHSPGKVVLGNKWSPILLQVQAWRKFSCLRSHSWILLDQSQCCLHWCQGEWQDHYGYGTWFRTSVASWRWILQSGSRVYCGSMCSSSTLQCKSCFLLFKNAQMTKINSRNQWSSWDVLHLGDQSRIISASTKLLGFKLISSTKNSTNGEMLQGTTQHWNAIFGAKIQKLWIWCRLIECPRSCDT